MADANSDGAPLVAITGQVSTDKIHLTAHQFLDLTKMFEPVTKRTKLVMRPDSIAEITRLAFKYAEGEGKPGATHIDLPCRICRRAKSRSTAQARTRKPRRWNTSKLRRA